MSEPELIRVMIVDDHMVVRNGIKFSLLAFDDLTLVGEAGSGAEALRICLQSQPDVILMDLAMPGMDGIATTRAIRETLPGAQVVILTSYLDGEKVKEAIQAGAIGFLLKDIAIDELAQAIRFAHQGLPILAPAAVQALVQITAQPDKGGFDLSDREMEVLILLAEGLSNDEIAERLVISTATVKFHLRRLRSKMGASSRTEAVALAFQYNLLKHRNPCD